MSQFSDDNVVTIAAGGTITQYDLVQISGATVIQNELATIPIGTALKGAASGALVPVKLVSGAGTHKVRVKEALSAGALLYTESAGEVQDTAQATAYPIGYALEAATAEDDIIEMVFASVPAAAQ